MPRSSRRLSVALPTYLCNQRGFSVPGWLSVVSRCGPNGEEDRVSSVTTVCSTLPVARLLSYPHSSCHIRCTLGCSHWHAFTASGGQLLPATPCTDHSDSDVQVYGDYVLRGSVRRMGDAQTTRSFTEIDYVCLNSILDGDIIITVKPRI